MEELGVGPRHHLVVGSGNDPDRCLDAWQQLGEFWKLFAVALGVRDGVGEAIAFVARASAMSVAATQSRFGFAGLPLSSRAYAIRIWVAVVIALGISFWLQLEAPFAALRTIAILAEPARAQALQKTA